MTIETGIQIINNRVKEYLETLSKDNEAELSVSALIEEILSIDITGSDETLGDALEILLRPGSTWPAIVA